MGKRKAASIEGDQQDIARTSEATSASGESSEGQGVFRQELDNGCDSPPQNRTSQEQNNTSQDDDGSEGSGKKQRLVWSRQLHAKFIEAVKILGHNAVPTKILRLMNEPEVTREQVASHLQKYRLQLKKLAGLPPDAPLDTQTKEIMQATQNIFAAATLPSTVLPGLMSTVPLQSGLTAMPQMVYSIPQGLTFVNGLSAAVQQPLHAFSKSGLAAHQPVLTALGAGNMMALNMLPVTYNYNPYNVMVVPQGMYSGLGAGVPSPLDALQAEYESRDHGREDKPA